MRAIKVLYNLARGHASLSGRDYITLDDVPIVVKTVLSTAHIDRVSILFHLLDNNGVLTTTQIMDYLSSSAPTALRTMTELKAVGLVTKTEDQIVPEEGPPYYLKKITLKPEFNWLLGEDFNKLREDFTPVDNREFMEDKTPLKAKSTPIAYSFEQVDTFWRVFDSVNGEGVITGADLKTKLVSSSKFTSEDATGIIDVMVKYRSIKKLAGDIYAK